MMLIACQRKFTCLLYIRGIHKRLRLVWSLEMTFLDFNVLCFKTETIT